MRRTSADAVLIVPGRLLLPLRANFLLFGAKPPRRCSLSVPTKLRLRPESRPHRCHSRPFAGMSWTTALPAAARGRVHKKAQVRCAEQSGDARRKDSMDSGRGRRRHGVRGVWRRRHGPSPHGFVAGRARLRRRFQADRRALPMPQRRSRGRRGARPCHRASAAVGRHDPGPDPADRRRRGPVPAARPRRRTTSKPHGARARSSMAPDGEAPERDAIALIVNSAIVRVQDQLHIHIGCLIPSARHVLALVAPKVSDRRVGPDRGGRSPHDVLGHARSAERSLRASTRFGSPAEAFAGKARPGRPDDRGRRGPRRRRRPVPDPRDLREGPGRLVAFRRRPALFALPVPAPRRPLAIGSSPREGRARPMEEGARAMTTGRGARFWRRLNPFNGLGAFFCHSLRQSRRPALPAASSWPAPGAGGSPLASPR